MDRQKIYAQLVSDEGVRLDAYQDTLGNLTVGVGHLCTFGDNLTIGDTISEDRCEQLFNADLDRAVGECKKIIQNFNALPETAQEVLVNMCFNMGPIRLLQFHHFLEALKAGRYVIAAAEMKNSLWYKQVGARAERLANQILSLANQTI